MASPSHIIATRIHALIQSKPSSPSVADISALVAKVQSEQVEAPLYPTDAIGAEIRETIAAFRALSEATPGNACTDDDDAQSEFVRLERRLDELEAKLPATAQTVSQVFSKAELAWFWADKELSEELTAIVEDEDCADVASARLIVAVLQFAGLGSRYKVEA